MNVDVLRHHYPVKPEMAAILMRDSPPSASDVAVMRETGEFFSTFKRCFLHESSPTWLVI